MQGQTDVYDMLKQDARGWLNAVYDLSAMSGNPDQEFYYLGGPMTGIPQFNFPEFDRVAKILREAGYNIVSPAELDSPGDYSAAMASPDGAPGSGSNNGKEWHDFLMRDVVICAMPTCIGGIFMSGWEDSSGACLESYVLSRLKKTLYTYSDVTWPTRGFALSPLDRDEALKDRVANITKSIEEVV